MHVQIAEVGISVRVWCRPVAACLSKLWLITSIHNLVFSFKNGLSKCGALRIGQRI